MPETGDFCLSLLVKVAKNDSVIPVSGFFRYLVNKKLRRRPFSGVIVNSGIQVSGILVGICIARPPSS